MTKRWRFFQMPPEMSTVEVIESVRLATEGRPAAFVDIKRANPATGAGGVIRRKDQDKFLHEARDAQAQGESARALELLNTAAQVDLLGQFNEECGGFTNVGRPQDSFNKSDPDGAAVDFIVNRYRTIEAAEGEAVERAAAADGFYKRHRPIGSGLLRQLAAEAIEAGLAASVIDGKDARRSLRERIVNKAKRRLGTL
jgi:hypothetical protein